jgi:hypothetical protein
MIKNDWLNFIDETIKLADDGKKRVEKPEYLAIDSTVTITKEKAPTDLVNEGLVQGMVEALKSPAKQILK